MNNLYFYYVSTAPKDDNVHASAGESQSTLNCQPRSSGSLSNRYTHTMVLSAVGDAMGYYKGKFEFLKSGPKIHEAVNNDLGGLDKLELSCKYWTHKLFCNNGTS